MRTALGSTLAAAVIAAGASTMAEAQSRFGGYFWQGPYVGVNLGYQWSSVSNNATKPNGLAGGVQAGYSWQSGMIVFGAEADIQLSGADDLFAPWKFSNPWFGTLRGRGGFLLNSTALIYGTVGLAYGSLRAQSTLTGVTESRTSVGWAVGAGVEVALTGNWTAKAEYLYVDLSERSYSLTGVTSGINANILRMGVNYRF
jgi:outer membrane immunogenic protein